MRAQRRQRGLSLRELQAACGVTYTVVSNIERGERAVGAGTAERLADGLGLRGEEREQFLFQAAATRRRDRLVGYARELEPEILNFLPKVLASQGVDLGGIERSAIRSNLEGEGENPVILSRLQAAYERILEACAGRRTGDFLLVDAGGQKLLCTLLMVPTV